MWMLAEKYGWSLEYIKALTLEQYSEEVAVMNAISRYKDSASKKK
jgi:hypothetical protein